MKPIKKFILILCITTTTLLLSSCGFHLRSSSDIPPQLRTLSLQTAEPYSTFMIELKNTLQSLNIHLVDTPKKAPVILHVFDMSITHSNPTITDSSQAIAYEFYFRVTVQLTSPQGEIITPAQIFTTDQVIYLNPNEIYTINSQNLASGVMFRDAISLIYHWLAATDTRKALKQYFASREKNHANLSQSTQTKSR